MLNSFKNKIYKTHDNNINYDINIFLIVGLGSNELSFIVLKKYLKIIGFNNVHCISYRSNELNYEESMEHVDNELEKYCSKEDEIICIGQSFGGVISNNLHRYGWSLLKGIYIGSPLKGAEILNFASKVKENIPERIYSICVWEKPLYDYLREKNN